MSDPLEFAVYERPFARPFLYGRHALRLRRGVLLRRPHEEGFLYGEAAPLEGHSRDNLEEVLAALPGCETATTLPPSLRCALEGMQALARPGTFPVRANALLGAEGEHATTRLAAFTAEGYRVCKIKLLPTNLTAALDLLEQNEDLLFRLDANQSLDAASFARFLESLARRRLTNRVDYIEEPFPEIWQQPSFRESPVPLAADESAPGLLEANALCEAPLPPNVFIVKPMVAGGMLSLEAPLEELRGRGKRIVFTSTLETEIGRRALLAFLSQAPREVAGVSTGQLFHENYLTDRAEWSQVPAPSAEELAYLSTLDWRRP